MLAGRKPRAALREINSNAAAPTQLKGSESARPSLSARKVAPSVKPQQPTSRPVSADQNKAKPKTKTIPTTATKVLTAAPARRPLAPVQSEATAPSVPSKAKKTTAPSHTESQLRKDDSPVTLNKEDCLLIFDWDDTLFPTHYLEKLNSGEEHDVSIFEEVAEAITITLKMAMRHGTCVVVTNSDDGWVHESCRRFMPQILPLMATIQCISARSIYEPLFRDGRAPMPVPHEVEAVNWKVQAFWDLVVARVSMVTQPDLTAPPHKLAVVSIGDSICEQRALEQVGQWAGSLGSHWDIRLRCVKFAVMPSVKLLLQQQQTLRGAYRSLCSFVSE